MKISANVAHFIRSLRVIGAMSLLLALGRIGLAEGLREEMTPFTAWLDFPRLAGNGWPRVTSQWWLESVTGKAGKNAAGGPETTFRVRFRALRDLDNELQLRLFFPDTADGAPVISGFSETGTERFTRTLKTYGLGLPTSESVTFPSAGLDYIEIRVAGDGKDVRGAFLAVLKTQPAQHALDFAPPVAVIDPFGQSAPLPAVSEDSSLYGRVKATLDEGTAKISPEDTAGVVWEFELQAPPLLALISFEALNADNAAPLEATINDRPLGAVAVQWPDLADPGYLGVARPLESGLRFQYTGWLRGQIAIPGNALRAGMNRLTLRLPAKAGPAAVRTLQIQLKNAWKNLDYSLAPTLP
jgi:hypothetical protein